VARSALIATNHRSAGSSMRFAIVIMWSSDGHEMPFRHWWTPCRVMPIDSASALSDVIEHTFLYLSSKLFTAVMSHSS